MSDTSQPVATCTYRDVDDGDLAAIAKLEQQVYPIEGWWDEDAYRRDYALNGHMYRCAIDTDTLIGYVTCRADGALGEIATLTVDGDYRGRGIGRTLLRQALERLAGAGCEHVVLETRVDNHAALALYRSEGFTVVDVLTDWYDVNVDAVRMLYRVEVAGENERAKTPTPTRRAAVNSAGCR